MKRHSDWKLARKAVAGSEEAWTKIFESNRPRIMALMGRLVGYEQAEDLTQDAFVQAVRKLHLYKGQSSLSTFLYRLSFNIALMSLRKRRIDTVSLDEMLEWHDGTSSELQSQTFQPNSEDQSLQWTDIRLRLEKAIAELPEGQRLQFLLHDLEGYQHGEIADATNITVANSKTKVREARLSLRAKLGATR